MIRARERVLVERRMATDLAAVTIFAALTAVGARLSFHLPYTPVPVTGQVFCVLLAGAVLGPRLGFASQVEYLAAGAAGLPVFSAGGGVAAMLGPTAGYLLCFPFAALMVGTIVGRLGQSTWSYSIAGLAGVGSIYLLGASWFMVWSAFLGRSVALVVVLTQSVVPFVALDVVKAALMASVAPSIRRRLRMW